MFAFVYDLTLAKDFICIHIQPLFACQVPGKF